MSVRATPVDMRQRYQFAIEIDGFRPALFMKSDLPEETVGIVEFNQAGTLHPSKYPGRKTWNDIEMEKGILLDEVDSTAYDWIRLSGDPQTGTSLPRSQITKDVDILHLDTSGSVIERYVLKNAWISKLAYEGLEGGSQDHMIEKMTLTYDYSVRV